MAKANTLTNSEIEQLFGWTPYDNWELVELGIGGFTFQDDVSFEIPSEEEDALYEYFKTNPSCVITLYDFHRLAPRAFLHLVRKDKEACPVTEFTPDDWHSWGIHAPEALVYEVLEQMAADEGEEYIPAQPTSTPLPTRPVHCSQRDWDIERSFIYLQRLRFPDVDNPRPDCLTGDIRVLPRNRFWRSVAQLWGSISPFCTHKQRFTYWMLYKYEHL